MKRSLPLVALAAALTLSVLMVRELQRPPFAGSPSYQRGFEDGTLIGHNHMVNGGSLSPEARIAASASDLPWSVRLSLPRRIGDYRAGWVAGYDVGVNWHTPVATASRSESR